MYFQTYCEACPVAEEVMDIPAERDITRRKPPPSWPRKPARPPPSKLASLQTLKDALVADLEKFSRTHTKEGFVEHWKTLSKSVRAAVGIAETALPVSPALTCLICH